MEAEEMKQEDIMSVIKRKMVEIMQSTKGLSLPTV